MKKQGGAYARRRGHSFEREIANKFKEFYPESKRHLEMQMQEAKGFDIEVTDFYIQCKRNKQWCPLSKIKEIIPTDKKHLLVTKGDREKEIVAMYLDDFLELLRKVNKCL